MGMQPRRWFILLLRLGIMHLPQWCIMRRLRFIMSLRQWHTLLPIHMVEDTAAILFSGL